MTTPPQHAAVYARLSQDRTGESLGIDRQEHLCRQLAEGKGWTVAEVYTDRDLSAYSGKRRPQYERLLDDLKNGVRDAVIVVDQDRLTRSPKELEGFIDLADANGIGLASVSGEIDLGTSDGRFRARIMGTVARQESEKKSERLVRQRDQAARLGLFQGGPRRYGFEPDGVTFVTAEVKIIREIASRFLAGESSRSIVLDLNTRGVGSAKGGPWGIAQMQRMITSPRLAGLRSHHGEIVGEAQWKAILDRNTHERLRARLVDGRKPSRGRPALSLLGGIATCARCGAPLHQNRRDGKRIYQCSGLKVNRSCAGVIVQAEPLDALVDEAIVYRIDTKAVGNALIRTRRKTVDRVDRDVEDVGAIETDLEALAADFGDGLISRREWLAARERLDKRRKQALAALEPEPADATAIQALRTSADVRAAWAASPIDTRRQVLRSMVQTLSVGPTQRPGTNAFEPDRVSLIWRV